jgi:hypothetical protein
MNNKLEMIWRETAVTEFELLTRHVTGEPEENHITTAGVPTLLLELAFSVIDATFTRNSSTHTQIMK